MSFDTFYNDGFIKEFKFELDILKIFKINIYFDQR